MLHLLLMKNRICKIEKSTIHLMHLDHFCEKHAIFETNFLQTLHVTKINKKKKIKCSTTSLVSQKNLFLNNTQQLFINAFSFGQNNYFFNILILHIFLYFMNYILFYILGIYTLRQNTQHDCAILQRDLKTKTDY